MVLEGRETTSNNLDTANRLPNKLINKLNKLLGAQVSPPPPSLTSPFSFGSNGYLTI